MQIETVKIEGDKAREARILLGLAWTCGKVAKATGRYWLTLEADAFYSQARAIVEGR